MCSLAVGTPLDSFTSMNSHRPILQCRMCPDVEVLAARGTPTAKQQNALFVLNAAPHSSLFSHYRCANGSCSVNCDNKGGANVRPHTDNLDRRQRFLITLVRSVCPFKYQYCSMQARYISSYQSMSGLFPLTQWLL
jgi:hypothetical protein